MDTLWTGPSMDHPLGLLAEIQHVTEGLQTSETEGLPTEGLPTSTLKVHTHNLTALITLILPNNPLYS